MWIVLIETARAAASTNGLSIAAPPGGGLCPGEKLEAVVTATDAKGKAVKVKLGPKSGVTLAWDVGPVDEHGAVTMPTDPRTAWGKPGMLTATLAADPGVHAEVAVPLRFDCTVAIDVSPAPANSGDKGTDSRSGDGAPGSPGDLGKDAPAVAVKVVLAKEPRTGVDVLQIAVTADQTTHYAAVLPDVGRLMVTANGGTGGAGGPGGDSGQVSSQGNSGSSGFGKPGSGGPGGTGGQGGAVTVTVDPSAQGRAAKSLGIQNVGGAGGPGGPGGGVGVSVGTTGTTGGNVVTQGAKQGSGGASQGGQRNGPVGGKGMDGPPPQVQVDTVGPLW